jgi:hypothetical protein
VGTLERTGASYENSAIRVPTTALTVMAAETLPPLPEGALHSTVVVVVHEVVGQTFEEGVTAVGVVSERYPKLAPVSVSMVPPDDTKLSDVPALKTGASNVKVPILVPTIAEMETN